MLTTESDKTSLQSLLLSFSSVQADAQHPVRGDAQHQELRKEDRHVNPGRYTPVDGAEAGRVAHEAPDAVVARHGRVLRKEELRARSDCADAVM